MAKPHKVVALKDFEDSAFQNNDVLIGYMSATVRRGEKTVKLPVKHLKSLFNLAAKDIPRELQETQQGDYTVSKAQVRHLVNAAAKHQGYSLHDRAALYLRMRLR
ncbi:MAG: hypothetical protein PSY14_01880 [bacterium]|nr:hypothetical protein [bacterium]